MAAQGNVDSTGGECRFGFPFKTPFSFDARERQHPWETHVRVKEFEVGSNEGDKKEQKHRIELVTKRNDGWLNSHCRQ